MWTDPIVEELHRIRENHAKQFEYNVKAMSEDIKKQEQQSGKTYISLPIQHRTSQPKATTETRTEKALTGKEEYA